MALAHEHASASAAERWADEAGRVRRAGHPSGQPAIFYERFEDESFVQVTVEPDGEVRIEPGVGYRDADAQTGALYGQEVVDSVRGHVLDAETGEPLRG